MRTDWAVSFATGALLVLAAYAAGSLELPAKVAQIADLVPGVIGALLVLLGWRFRRSRLALTAALITVLDLILAQGYGRGDAVNTVIEQNVLVVLVSLNLALLAGVRSRRLLHPMVLVHAVLLAIQPWFVRWVLSSPESSTMAGQVRAACAGILSAPEAQIAAPFLAAAAIIVGMMLRRGTFESCLLWVLTATVLAILGDPESTQFAIPAAQLTLLAGFVESSYRLAYHDELTGLPGRRALNEALRSLGGSYSIGMVDIDHFKRFNDRHGHDVGDQVLRMVAARLAKVQGGTVYRYGGEEFAVVLPGLQVADAASRLDELRASISDTPFAIRSRHRPKRKPKRAAKRRNGSTEVTVTVSIGVASPSVKHPDTHHVVEAADQALYRAKHRGRNRVATSRS